MPKHTAGPGAPAFPITATGAATGTPKHRKQDRNPDAKEVQDLAKAS